MTKYALQARWVLPLEAPAMEGAVVTIEDEKIVAVGPHCDRGTPLHDLGDVVLLPGLVNAHTHLEFSQLNEPLGRPGMPLSSWIQLVIANRKQSSAPALGLVAGLRESLRAGVTTLGEISTGGAARPTLHELPLTVEFQEVIGFSSARVNSVFSEVQTRLQMNGTGVRLGISPHAPYTVHPQLLEKLVELACEQRLPVAMHLAESRDELQLLRSNRGPLRELLSQRSMWDSQVFASAMEPIDYLQRLAQAPRALVIHGNYLSQQEIEFVARHRERMSVIYCPRTHAYFGHTQYPLQEMVAAGVQLAVGTDSRASNPDLSLLEELRFLARHCEDLSLEQILLLGTLEGAKALGLADWVGSLVPGKLANLTTVECASSERSPLAAVLQSDKMPYRTWLRGRELRTVD